MFFILRCIHFILRRFVALDQIIYRKIEILQRAREDEDIKIEGFLEKNSYFQKIKVITHAGGIQGLKYLNCMEAFDLYYENGNRVFEYDVCMYADNNFKMSHVLNQDSVIDGRFHSINIDLVLFYMQRYKDLYIVFDCKFKNKMAFASYLLEYTSDPEILERIIIQVFNESEINEIRSVYAFQLLYVCMRESNYNEIAKICCNYKVYAVSIPYVSLKERLGWTVFNECNICTFVFTINTVSEYQTVCELKHTGAFSNFLYEKDVCHEINKNYKFAVEQDFAKSNMQD